MIDNTEKDSNSNLSKVNNSSKYQTIDAYLLTCITPLPRSGWCWRRAATRK
jgi:hypothetical protein